MEGREKDGTEEGPGKKEEREEGGEHKYLYSQGRLFPHQMLWNSSLRTPGTPDFWRTDPTCAVGQAFDVSGERLRSMHNASSL